MMAFSFREFTNLLRSDCRRSFAMVSSSAAANREKGASKVLFPLTLQ